MRSVVRVVLLALLLQPGAGSDEKESKPFSSPDGGDVLAAAFLPSDPTRLLLLTPNHAYSLHLSDSGVWEETDQAKLSVVGVVSELRLDATSAVFCDNERCRRMGVTTDGELGDVSVDVPIPEQLETIADYSTLLTRNGVFYTGGNFSWQDVSWTQPIGVQVQLADGKSLRAPEFGFRKDYMLQGTKEKENYYGLPPSKYLLSFESQGFVYFVRNVMKEEKEEMAAAYPSGVVGYDQPVKRRRGLEVAQVCANDTVGEDPEDTLLTWMNVELDVTQTGRQYNVTVNDVLFLESEDVFVVHASVPGFYRVAWFPMDTLRSAFVSTYSDCQKRKRSLNAVRFHTISRTRKSPGYCVKRGCSSDFAYGRCEAATCGDAPRLDNFSPFTTESSLYSSKVQLSSTLSGVRLLPGNAPNSVFLLYFDGELRKISFASTHSNSVGQPQEYAVPGTNIPNPMNTAVASNGAGQLVYSHGSVVKRVELDCSLVGEDRCEESTALPYQEQEGCEWCAEKQGGGGKAVLAGTCPAPRVRRFCPPMVTGIHKDADPVSRLYHVYGDHLERLNKKNLSITVCDSSCNIIRHEDKELDCQLDELQDSNCDSHIVASYHYSSSNISYPFNYKFSSNNSPVPVTGGMGGLPAVVQGLIGFGVLLLLAVVVGVICYAQRIRRRKKEDSSSMSPLPMDLTSSTHRAGNQYTGHEMSERMGNPQLYEDMSHLVHPTLLIPFSAINISSEIGSGHFGTVYCARYVRPDEPEAQPQLVAIKTLNSPTGVREFLKEGLRMENFEHDRVMSLLGISFRPDNNYPMIVTPYMAKGDLLSYIQNTNNSPTLGKLLNFCVEIAEGMAYLHKLKFIHRDLAARNCMLDEDLHIRIADFGLTRDVYNEDSYIPQTERFMPLRWLAIEAIERWIYTSKGDVWFMPLRWLAIEAIERWIYTSKGDVWAYGITCWEILTRGLIPYHELETSFQVLEFLKSGRRLPKPSAHCPDSMYRVMQSCWAKNGDERPSFSELCLSVPAVIAELADAPYLHLPFHHTYVNYSPPSLQPDETPSTFV